MKSYRTVVEITYVATPKAAGEIHDAIDAAIDRVFEEGPLPGILGPSRVEYIGSHIARYEVLQVRAS